MIWATLAFGFEPLSPDAVGEFILFVLVSLMIGTIYGVIMSAPAYLLTQLLRWSLKGIVSDRGAAGIFGGMTGFLCTSGGGLFFAYLPFYGEIWDLLPLFLISILAIAMGHVGAICAGYRRRVTGFPFFVPIFSFKKQITISYLMKLTLILAVLAALFKAAGTAGVNIGIAWSTYLLVQTLLLICDHWITRRLSRRREICRRREI